MALESVEGLIKGLENQESWQVQRQFRLVLMHWPKTVGFSVARKTRPVSIQRGILSVATATASWAQTLSYERFNILRKLNHHQRQPLRGIRFSTAQWAQGGAIESDNLADNLANDLVERRQDSCRLAQHPSYIGDVSHLPTVLEQTGSEQTPQIAFQRWATTLQSMQCTQSICPVCGCHCPQGELDRWMQCGHCAAKHWQ